VCGIKTRLFIYASTLFVAFTSSGTLQRQPTPYSPNRLKRLAEKSRRRSQRSLTGCQGGGFSVHFVLRIARPNPRSDHCSHPFRTVSEDVFSETYLGRAMLLSISCLKAGSVGSAATLYRGPLRRPRSKGGSMAEENPERRETLPQEDCLFGVLLIFDIPLCESGLLIGRPLQNLLRYLS
jgi:hypothetical protein